MPVDANSHEHNSAQVYKGSLAYNSLWQVRADAWSSLEESAVQLALAGTQQRPVEELIQAVAGSLHVLGSMERFWAIPGMPVFQKLRRLFAAGKYDRLAAEAGRINRALATGSYRTDLARDLGPEDDASDHEAYAAPG